MSVEIPYQRIYTRDSSQSFVLLANRLSFFDQLGHFLLAANRGTVTQYVCFFALTYGKLRAKCHV